VRFLVDAWGWYALGNARDPQRDHVETFYRGLRQVGALIYTTDYILDETITLLFRRISSSTARPFTQGLLDAIAQGHLRQEEITADRLKRAWGLRERLHDRPMISFTDLTSFVVMQDLRLSQVVTDDVHFSQIGMGFQVLPGRSEKRQ